MPKNLKFQNRSKPGPTSHTGPKTSRAAPDRPEPNLRRNQTSRHDIAGNSPERWLAGGRRHEKSRRHKGARAAHGRAHHHAISGATPLDTRAPSCGDQQAVSRATSSDVQRPSRRRAGGYARQFARGGAHIQPPSSQRPATKLRQRAGSEARHLARGGASQSTSGRAASAQVVRLVCASYGAPPHTAAAGGGSENFSNFRSEI
ncbi:hypothetical protein F511_45239 [Dorcoceras hygrometricum]|uniref:Uncharacterized protein n=1 Tax=Dorcoceras hygrometricum TaxID=472368 RepID=A0A2Z6ZWH9_9LAMI|nr:hypothetical protein F511_45239 [Dorcoceras hygrometricum]